jgi:hypothetical protein
LNCHILYPTSIDEIIFGYSQWEIFFEELGGYIVFSYALENWLQVVSNLAYFAIFSIF